MLRYLLVTNLCLDVVKQRPGSLLHGAKPSANDQAALANLQTNHTGKPSQRPSNAPAAQPPKHPDSTPRLPYSPAVAPV